MISDIFRSKPESKQKSIFMASVLLSKLTESDDPGHSFRALSCLVALNAETRWFSLGFDSQQSQLFDADLYA